jgi:thiol-disulfide isomerase/thioredoxin
MYSIADSITKYSPYSDSYYRIALSLYEANRYIPTALYYAQKSVEVDDVPIQYREGTRLRNLTILGRLYLAAGNDNEAEKAFSKAIVASQSLPSDHPWVKNKNTDFNAGVAFILKSLGLLKEKSKDYDSAIHFYKQGLTREPSHAELWTLLQRAYIFKNGSDAGYDAFREAFAKILPKQELGQSVPKTFPDFSLKTLDQKEIKSADLRSKIAVINFWAFWCGPCLQELSVLERLYQEYRDRSVEMIGVHIGLGMFNIDDEKASVRHVLSKYSVSFPVVFDTEGLGSKLGHQGVPSTYILDKSGVIRFKKLGYDPDTFYENFKEQIDKLVAE